MALIRFQLQHANSQISTHAHFHKIVFVAAIMETFSSFRTQNDYTTHFSVTIVIMPTFSNFCISLCERTDRDCVFPCCGLERWGRVGAFLELNESQWLVWTAARFVHPRNISIIIMKADVSTCYFYYGWRDYHGSFWNFDANEKCDDD